MPAYGWKYYASLFAVVSGMPVFCYWYYGLPSVVDRYTEKWTIEDPVKDNREFHEFMRELSNRKRKLDHAELAKLAAEEEERRHTLYK
ncbi:unnamed protein product [Thelazia callipaeda]|uniref:Uncharacterized protein n=1 Tax=Thelazia callipaeda TaxID=103827 RepID=A0A0N5CJD7_THECL|nr:unnamed protein product [Thelazia callipaeda]